MDYTYTIKKGGVTGFIALVGIGLEAAVVAKFGLILPAGAITGAVTAAGAAALNWLKHRKD